MAGKLSAIFERPGVSLWILASRRLGCACLVKGLITEHGVEDVTAAAGKADEGGVVFLAFGSFAVVVGAAVRFGQGCEGGEEEGAFEFAVAGAGGVFAADAACRNGG